MYEIKRKEQGHEKSGVWKDVLSGKESVYVLLWHVMLCAEKRNR